MAAQQSTMFSFRGNMQLAAIIIAGFCFQASQAQNGEWKTIKKKHIVGNWKLISYKEPNDSVFHFPENGEETIKLNTGTHYSFAYFNKSKAQFTMAGGGIYTYTNGIYTETMEYFSLRPSLAMKSFSFSLMVKGDSLYQKSTTKNGLEEYWIRQR